MLRQKTEEIIILTNTLLQGGAEKQCVLLANALCVDYNTTIVVYYGNLFDERLVDLIDKTRIEVIFLKGRHLAKMFRLFKIFRKNHKSVIFSYLATTNIINGIVGSLAGVKLRVGGIRNAEIATVKKIIQRLIHNYFLSASVFNNEEGYNALTQQGFAVNKSYVIPNCIKIKQPVKIASENNNVINILTVARFVEQKDYHTALEAFCLLLNSLKSTPLRITYNIVGFGEQEDQIRRWIIEMNLTSNVKVTINPENIDYYYQQSDIYLSTSLFEGLSNSIMEAMEYSLPVVATNVGDNKQLVFEGKNGFLVDVKDVNAIAGVLEQLVFSNDLRNRMGTQGYLYLTNNYSESKFKERYINLLKALNNG